MAVMHTTAICSDFTLTSLLDLGAAASSLSGAARFGALGGGAE